MAKLNEIDLPVVLKDKLLFGPGKWNDWNIEQEEVLKSIDNTEWNKKSRSLFYSHEDDKAEKWVGSISDEHIKDGKVYGDLKIFDADLALKLTDGEAPFAISAGIKWPAEYRDPVDFSYRNFSLVVNPGMHDEEIYINFSDKQDSFNEAKLIYATANFSETDFALVTSMEKKRKEMGLSLSQFYAAPRDPPSESALPIFDVAHVRNALARFNQTHFLSPSEKQKARRKIISAAKKFKIEITADFNIITEVEDDSESNLNIDERRLNAKMVNEEEKTENIEEKEENKEVEVESKEDTKTESEAEFSELKTKLADAIDRIKILEINQANFSEELKKSEETEKADVDKTEDDKEVVEKEEDKKEDAKPEVEEPKSEVADFAEIADKLDKVVNALEKKAAPMSTAEFSGISKKQSVTDRLTSFLKK